MTAATMFGENWMVWAPIPLLTSAAAARICRSARAWRW